MDDRRFDSLTKAIGLRTSRRSLLRGAIGALVAGIAGGFGAANEARAAVLKRPRICIQAGQPCKPASAGGSRGCCYKCNPTTGRCCETVRYACTADADCCSGLICRDPLVGDADAQRACFQPGALPAGAECRAGSECAAGGCANGRCCTPQHAACSANSQCCSGLVCRGGTCQPRGSVGQVCDESADCLAGLGCQAGTCCGLAQAACSANSQCCGGLVCRGGVCQARGALGQVCDEPADCQSGACDPDRRACCQSTGRICSANSQCCAGSVCRGGICQAPGQTGQACDEPADCANGNCDPNRRVCCLPSSSSCTSNSQCCGSDVCRGGRCQAAGGLGATCDEAADCATGLTCQNATCCAQQNTACTANSQCCNGLVCRGGACRPPGAGGAVCDEDADCASGTCNSGVCCVASGAACSGNTQCCNGLVCRAGTCLPPGAGGDPCDEDDDCAAGTCNSGVCCIATSGACTAPEQCCSGDICRGGVCQPPGGAGESCNSAADCARGFSCNSGVCCANASTTCAANSDCCSPLVCRGDICAVLGALGDICDTSDGDADCSSGLACENGTCCGGRATACTDNVECCSGLVCRGGICQAAGGQDDVCDEDADCISGFLCEGQQCCADEGTTCTDNTDCCDGLTCISGACAEPSGIGGACDEDDDCADGRLCESSTCCAAETTACTTNNDCCDGLYCDNLACADVPPPVANLDQYSGSAGAQLSVSAADGVLANDTTVVGSLSVTAFDATSTEGGTVAVAADGSFTYTPAGGFTGTDAFTYTASGPGGSAVGNVSIFVPIDEPFWGEVRMFAFHFAPRNWAHCNGQLLPISQNTTLFTLLGTTYGGDGRVTFALPDLRGRVPINAGNVYTIGERAGEATHTLIASELPAHTHTVNGTSAAADQTSPEGNLPAQAAAEIYNGSLAALTSLDASSVASAGGSQAHSNMQPFLTVSFCIAMSGQFPPR